MNNEMTMHMLEGFLFEILRTQRKEPLHAVGENTHWDSHFGKLIVSSSEI